MMKPKKPSPNSATSKGNMSDQDKRELDAWIAEHVMGWKRGPQWGNGNGEWLNGEIPVCTWHTAPQFCTNPVAAMALLEKCAKKAVSISIVPQSNGGWIIYAHGIDTNMVEADDLPLAICLFAKKLYSHEP